MIALLVLSLLLAPPQSTLPPRNTWATLAEPPRSTLPPRGSQPPQSTLPPRVVAPKTYTYPDAPAGYGWQVTNCNKVGGCVYSLVPVRK
jgi:hypothetical protein